MRVLLINPPYPVVDTLTMPLGLLYLAARLEEGGHQVVLEDLQLSRSPLRRVESAVRRHDPAVVGVTSFSINLHRASRILRKVKSLSPHAVTVWGGPHVSFDDRETLQGHPWVDLVVRGEGEETLLKIVEGLESGRGLEGVAGLTWKPGGSLRRHPPRPFRQDLDRLPRPAWHLLKLSQYRAFGDGASLLTSRGCCHRCVFCVGRKMIGAKGRFRGLEAVVEEMEALAQMGFPRIRIEDDLFTYRPERALGMCREIHRRGLRVLWRAYCRVDTVNPELLGWMKKAGCERILYGAESGSPEILRRIRKGITPDQTRAAVEMTRQAGIGVLASFVLGLPGETPETLRQTLAFAESLQVPYSLNLLTPYVGTEVRERAERWGLRIHSHDWGRYGQGRALTSTEEAAPWHLSRARGKYRRGLVRYLEDLLEGERQGRLSPEDREELERNRHRAFLRALIGGELLERFGSAPPGSGLGGLAGSLAPHLGMREEEVSRRLEPHVRQGHIRPAPGAGGVPGWSWADS